MLQVEKGPAAATPVAAPPPPGWEPQIVALICNWCTYAGADMAGTTRRTYPATVRPIRVPCTGRIDPLLIVKAFDQGADAVVVSGCHPGDCHYVQGNLVARRRFTAHGVALGLEGQCGGKGGIGERQRRSKVGIGQRARRIVASVDVGELPFAPGLHQQVSHAEHLQRLPHLRVVRARHLQSESHRVVAAEHGGQAQDQLERQSDLALFHQAHKRRVVHFQRPAQVVQRQAGGLPQIAQQGGALGHGGFRAGPLDPRLGERESHVGGSAHVAQHRGREGLQLPRQRGGQRATSAFCSRCGFRLPAARGRRTYRLLHAAGSPAFAAEPQAWRTCRRRILPMLDLGSGSSLNSTNRGIL